MVFHLAGQLAETAPGNIQQAYALAATISISSWNYAYAVLESRVRMEIVAEGYDPTIGFLHKFQADRLALVFDFMEPMRPIVDRRALEFVESLTFHPADFTLRSDGVCRLNLGRWENESQFFVFGVGAAHRG